MSSSFLNFWKKPGGWCNNQVVFLTCIFIFRFVSGDGLWTGTAGSADTSWPPVCWPSETPSDPTTRKLKYESVQRSVHLCFFYASKSGCLRFKNAECQSSSEMFFRTFMKPLPGGEGKKQGKRLGCLDKDGKRGQIAAGNRHSIPSDVQASGESNQQLQQGHLCG